MRTQYDWKEIGKRIAFERTKNKRMTLEEVAEYIGTTRQTVSRWEKGKGVEITLNMLLRLCSLFDCELGYLLCEEGFELKTRAKTDFHELTGLSENAIESITERKEAKEVNQAGESAKFVLKVDESAQIEVLSKLLCSLDFWRVLRLMRQGIESIEYSQSGSAKDTIRHIQNNGVESVVLTGNSISEHFKNSAINLFTAIVEEMIRTDGEDSNEQKKR